ncbi:Biotin synthase [Rickettsia tillamookensis]|uniref:Biotin synthase n=1 Tax=Rickettsia tillamookensis TaxID=2761623 RepID=A0A9E6MHL9_9RICK|nr:biotin synthase BioB [Rickettsia tillamookensis]QQV74925.1 Biotin synthase [Rickettsia tillamookensis]
MKKWIFDEAKEIFSLPFMELIYQAQTVHRANFDPSKIQISSLLSIKTGSCPENCKFCPQSAHYKTYVEKEPLIQIEEVITAAKRAKAAGSTRFCMGAAWRGPRDEDLKLVCEMIKEVKKLGLETCVTLGLLKEHQAVTLKKAGLDFYNHNIDTSKEFYDKIITTRTFQDRLDTLQYVRASGMKVCCGGILGMGETNDDRINMILTLANLEEPAESVTINKLIKIPGTPLENVEDIDPFDFVRVIALARIMIPKSYIRLSAGREQMSDELQALCIMAGINSIFYGEKLLTSANPMPTKDNELFERLSIK